MRSSASASTTPANATPMATPIARSTSEPPSAKALTSVSSSVSLEGEGAGTSAVTSPRRNLAGYFFTCADLEAILRVGEGKARTPSDRRDWTGEPNGRQRRAGTFFLTTVTDFVAQPLTMGRVGRWVVGNHFCSEHTQPPVGRHPCLPARRSDGVTGDYPWAELRATSRSDWPNGGGMRASILRIGGTTHRSKTRSSSPSWGRPLSTRMANSQPKKPMRLT